MHQECTVNKNPSQPSQSCIFYIQSDLKPYNLIVLENMKKNIYFEKKTTHHKKKDLSSGSSFKSVASERYTKFEPTSYRKKAIHDLFFGLLLNPTEQKIFTVKTIEEGKSHDNIFTKETNNTSMNIPKLGLNKCQSQKQFHNQSPKKHRDSSSRDRKKQRKLSFVYKQKNFHEEDQNIPEQLPVYTTDKQLVFQSFNNSVLANNYSSKPKQILKQHHIQIQNALKFFQSKIMKTINYIETIQADCKADRKICIFWDQYKQRLTEIFYEAKKNFDLFSNTAEKMADLICQPPTRTPAQRHTLGVNVQSHKLYFNEENQTPVFSKDLVNERIDELVSSIQSSHKLNSSKVQRRQIGQQYQQSEYGLHTTKINGNKKPKNFLEIVQNMSQVQVSDGSSREQNLSSNGYFERRSLSQKSVKRHTPGAIHEKTKGFQQALNRIKKIVNKSND